MKQAIVTKYISPTTYRGARVKASCDAGNITVDWNHDHGIEMNHWSAAYQLQCKLGWDKFNYSPTGGCYRKGYVFIQIPKTAMTRKAFEKLRDV